MTKEEQRRWERECEQRRLEEAEKERREADERLKKEEERKEREREEREERKRWRQEQQQDDIELPDDDDGFIRANPVSLRRPTINETVGSNNSKV